MTDRAKSDAKALVLPLAMNVLAEVQQMAGDSRLARITHPCWIREWVFVPDKTLASLMNPLICNVPLHTAHSTPHNIVLHAPSR